LPAAGQPPALARGRSAGVVVDLGLLHFHHVAAGDSAGHAERRLDDRVCRLASQGEYPPHVRRLSPGLAPCASLSTILTGPLSAAMSSRGTSSLRDGRRGCWTAYAARPSWWAACRTGFGWTRARGCASTRSSIASTEA